MKDESGQIHPSSFSSVPCGFIASRQLGDVRQCAARDQDLRSVRRRPASPLPVIPVRERAMNPKLCLLACAALFLTGAAWANDYTWTNPAGGNFAGNFTPGGTPVSAIDTTLIFPELLALPTGYTALNNLGSFTLNAVRFESQ